MTLKSSQFDSVKDSIADSMTSTPGSVSMDTGNAQSLHIEVQFQETSAKFYCKIYFAERFRMLRKLLFAEGEDAFVRLVLEIH